MPASVQHRLDEKVKVYNTSVNRIEARDSSANIYNEERVVSEKENEKEMKTTKPRVQ